jgi:hypothetical protein
MPANLQIDEIAHFFIFFQVLVLAPPGASGGQAKDQI